MSTTKRNVLGAVFAVAGVIAAVVLIVGLLDSDTRTVNVGAMTGGDDGSGQQWTEPDAIVRCGSVLSGPATDPSDRQARDDAEPSNETVDGLPVIAEDDASRLDDPSLSRVGDWVAATCDRARQQRLGTSVLWGAGATLGFSLAASAWMRRPERS
ncbi:hypothetical protein [Ruania alba]|uniref:Uncharacterized protein n=1 Tax=Ruania alba TaxID=648782 RepID=A0A1H5LVQ4_9MICO|nr:hypothetical protein [Ruania alba]SEE81175.1 hypothetical protein SAMN04488554_3010 [Ruania alba]